MKKNDENKTIFKQWTSVLLIIGVFAIFISGFCLVVSGFNPEESSKKELYSYDYNTNFDYKVYLKENNFFNTEYLGMNKQYIASLIDRIEVTANYDFTSTKDLDYTYSYSITATPKGLYEGSDGKSVEVWSRAYPLFNSETISGTGKKFSISQPITLDYNSYNDLMTNFREQFGLSVDARVDLTLNVNINAGLAGSDTKDLSKSEKINLKIPLLQQTIQINPDYVNTGHETVYENQNATESNINIPYILFGIVLMVFAVVGFVILLRKLLVITKKSEYLINYNKILKDYGDIIAETRNVPDLSNYEVIRVKDFNELVDIEEELHSPIICCEIKPDSECWFIIINSGVAYKYALTQEYFEHIIRD